MRLASKVMPGAIARTWDSKCGNRVTWLASVMQMRKRRCAVVGSNSVTAADRRCSPPRTSRTVAIKASLRGVGSMPSAVRTNSGSLKCSRKRPNPMLMVGWLRFSASAVRVTLRVLYKLSNKRSSLRSNDLSFSYVFLHTIIVICNGIYLNHCIYRIILVVQNR